MIEINIKNAAELGKRIHDANVQHHLNKALHKSILFLEGQTKTVTPVDTGLLRNSYETTVNNLEARLNNFRHYAPYVQARQKFLEKGVSLSENFIINIFDKEIELLLQSL